MHPDACTHQRCALFPVSPSRCSVMLWRRSDNVVFALLLGGAHLVAVGDGVEAQVKGILQVLDDQEGAVTKREYAQMMVPGAAPLLLVACGASGTHA